MAADIQQNQVEATKAPEVLIIGHSRLLYWWPVWVLGYIMALLTWLHPVGVQIDKHAVEVSSNTSLGVIFALVVLFTVLITTTKMRGVVSLVVVLVIGLLVLLFAYLNWWPAIVRWFGDQTVFMDMGFYLFFSTGLLLFWVITVFGFDRVSFWRVRPGQVTHESILGAIENSYETDNLVFIKRQNDLFRHWILGLGSGDLEMQTMGGRGVIVKVSNVAFLNWKVAKIQSLIATKPSVPQH